jgi:hypothetical protein
MREQWRHGWKGAGVDLKKKNMLHLKRYLLESEKYAGARAGLGCHRQAKVCEADAAAGVRVDFADHFFDFQCAITVTDRLEGIAQVGGGQVTVTITARGDKWLNG